MIIVSNLDFEAILECWGKKHVHQSCRFARMVTESQLPFPCRREVSSSYKSLKPSFLQVLFQSVC
jgi:hypothetical protein